jgi:hypothetical protein
MYGDNGTLRRPLIDVLHSGGSIDGGIYGLSYTLICVIYIKRFTIAEPQYEMCLPPNGGSPNMYGQRIMLAQRENGESQNE